MEKIIQNEIKKIMKTKSIFGDENKFSLSIIDEAFETVISELKARKEKLISIRAIIKFINKQNKNNSLVKYDKEITELNKKIKQLKTLVQHDFLINGKHFLSSFVEV